MNGRHDLVYFTDRDPGKRAAAVIERAGAHVERHDQHFSANALDEEWIRAVAQRGWIALTRDRRIRYSPLATSALMGSGARLFVLVGVITADDAAALFLGARPAIERFVASAKGPFIAKVRNDGVHPWLDEHAWRRGWRL
jgi:hypothetical protein